jgi:hypothetical protein
VSVALEQPARLTDERLALKGRAHLPVCHGLQQQAIQVTSAPLFVAAAAIYQIRKLQPDGLFLQAMTVWRHLDRDAGVSAVLRD